MTPTETVDASIGAIERKDVATAVAMLSEDVSYENMPMEAIVGPNGVAATLEMFLGPADEVDWQILRPVKEGDTVINERLDRFRIGDGWLELSIAGVFEVVDGKIRLWRDYFDMATYTTQMKALAGS